MDYLGYEATLPDIERTFFSNFKFYSKENITSKIKNSPEDTYGKVPEGVTPEQREKGPSNGSKINPSEVARMNKTLLLGNTSKIQAVADFAKSMFMRDLVKPYY